MFSLGNGKKNSIRDGACGGCGDKGMGQRGEAQGQRDLGELSLTKVTGTSLLLEFSKLLAGWRALRLLPLGKKSSYLTMPSYFTLETHEEQNNSEHTLFNREQINNKGLEYQRQTARSGLSPSGLDFPQNRGTADVPLSFYTELKPGIAAPTYPSTCQNPQCSAPPPFFWAPGQSAVASWWSAGLGHIPSRKVIQGLLWAMGSTGQSQAQHEKKSKCF